jgi:uncharacterized membrane protein HdeD (DUF308 family)
MSESGWPSRRTTGVLELVAGLAEIAGGVVILLWESPTGLVLGIVLGVVLIVEGAISAVEGFGHRGGMALAHGIRGALTVAVGVILVAWPDKTPLVLAIIIGGYLIGFGFYRIMSSVTETEPSSEVAQMLVGSVAVIGGFIIVANPPEGLRLLAVIVGVAALLDGVFRVRRGVADLVTPAETPDSVA